MLARLDMGIPTAWSWTGIVGVKLFWHRFDGRNITIYIRFASGFLELGSNLWVLFVISFLEFSSTALVVFVHVSGSRMPSTSYANFTLNDIIHRSTFKCYENHLSIIFVGIRVQSISARSDILYIASTPHVGHCTHIPFIGLLW